MMQRFRPMKSVRKPEGSEPMMQPSENMAVIQPVGRKDRGGIREREGRTSWREWFNDVDRGQVSSLDCNFSPHLIVRSKLSTFRLYACSAIVLSAHTVFLRDQA